MIQPGDAIGLESSGGQKNDRRLQAGTPQLTTYFEPVLSGQHHVQKNQIEGLFQRAPACRLTAPHNFYFVPFEAERVLQTERNTRFVFSNQDSWYARSRQRDRALHGPQFSAACVRRSSASCQHSVILDRTVRRVLFRGSRERWTPNPDALIHSAMRHRYQF